MQAENIAHAKSIRVGGLLLAVGAFAFLPIIYEYVFVVGTPAGTGTGGAVTTADVAAHTLSHWKTLSRGWHFEILVMVLMAAAGITLMGRRGAGRPGWALVVVGALITSPMYALMLGGYNVALNGAETDIALYSALRESALKFFYSGISVMRLGLAYVFLVEFATRSSTLWRALFILGFAANLVHGISFMALFFGASVPLAVISPFGLLGFIFTGILGLRVFRTSLGGEK